MASVIDRVTQGQKMIRDGLPEQSLEGKGGSEPCSCLRQEHFGTGNSNYKCPQARVCLMSWGTGMHRGKGREDKEVRRIGPGKQGLSFP